MAIWKTKRVLISTASLLLILVAVVSINYAVHLINLINLGVAYKAKMVCSEVFLAGREINTVLRELEVEDLSRLRAIDIVINRQARTVSGHLFGLGKNIYQYRDSQGCALVPLDKPIIPRNLEVSENSVVTLKAPSDTSQPLTPISYPALEAILTEAFAEPSSEYHRRTRAIVILHKGRIVAERYAPGIGPETPLLGWSMAKSVMNALVGILVQQKQLTLQTPVNAEPWQAASDPRKQIKVEHLLQMTSGLVFDEAMSRPLTDVTRMILQERNMASFAASKPLQAEPGQRWQYSSGNTNILSALLRRILGEARYPRFPHEALFNKLGMHHAVLETDTSGTFVGSSFMYATARDWAKLGQLYLQDGKWNDERVLPVGWVEYSRMPVAADPQAAYGAHFWLKIPEGYRAAASPLPADSFHAVGHEGQFVSIIPSHALVIVRMGKTRNPEAWQHDVFIHKVIEAMRKAR